MPAQISEERKAWYKIGLVMQIAGVCLFTLPFITIIGVMILSALHGGFEPKGIVFVPIAFGIGFIGFTLIAGGGVVRGVAARGKAGSGLTLDPEQARKDLEPWSRMGGGVVKDALDEVGVDIGQVGTQFMRGGDSQPQKVVMIKCAHCGKLNEEDSKFCQECGKSF
jgi:hypothetical protein